MDQRCACNARDLAGAKAGCGTNVPVRRDQKYLATSLSRIRDQALDDAICGLPRLGKNQLHASVGALRALVVYVSLAVKHNNGLVGTLRKRGNVRNERQTGAIKRIGVEVIGSLSSGFLCRRATLIQQCLIARSCQHDVIAIDYKQRFFMSHTLRFLGLLVLSLRFLGLCFLDLRFLSPAEPLVAHDRCCLSNVQGLYLAKLRKLARKIALLEHKARNS